MRSIDDRGQPELLEPLIVSEVAASRPRLNDLALTLAEKSAAFAASLPAPLASSLAELVTTVNCYYGHRIEGHDLNPIDIDRAKSNVFSPRATTRVLQLDALSTIAVQRWIDDNDIAAPFSTEAICEVHRRIYEHASPKLLQAGWGGHISIEPGALRTGDFPLGKQAGVPPGSVPRLLARLERGYRSAGRIDRILIAACGHHRLLRVHPFAYGNSRVARFVSYAALNSAITTKGLWSMVRGLARRNAEYDLRLQACDRPTLRRFAGEESPDEAALADFVEFFLETCIAEVDFMTGLMQYDDLRARVLKWADAQIKLGVLAPKSDAVLAAMLYRGELERREIVAVTGVSERSARRLTAALIKSGIALSTSSRSPLRLAFSAGLAMHILPGLFSPEQG